MLNLLLPLVMAQQFTGTDAGLQYSPSFADFGAITQSGGLNGVYGGRSLEWNVGDRPEDLLTLGDIDQLGVGDLTLQDISDRTGIDISTLTLEDYPLLADSSLEDVADAVGNDPAFLDTLLVSENKTVGEAISDGDGKKTLAETLGIDKPLKDIAKVQDAVIKKLTEYKNAAISEIPGLPQLPFAQYPAQLANQSLAAISFFAKADLILDKAEQGIDNTVTGSEKEKTGFQTPCPPFSPCGHVELKDSVSVNMAGKRWINGKHQKVRGGSGALGAIFENKEPTGRLPFGPGSPFKLVLTGTNELTDKASFSAYFKYETLLAGSTGYNIGPFPLYTAGINGSIWLGVNPAQFGQIPIGFDPAVGQGTDLSNTAPGSAFGLPSPTGSKGSGAKNKCQSRDKSRPNYIWPAPGPITSYYAPSRVHPIYGTPRPHYGIDIGNGFGTPLVAIEAGQVIYAGTASGFGLLLEIRDACTGNILRYGHLQKFYVSQGQEVRKGQPVGEMGSTGLSTGPHLHFEIWTNGSPINPLFFLSSTTRN